MSNYELFEKDLKNKFDYREIYIYTERFYLTQIFNFIIKSKFWKDTDFIEKIYNNYLQEIIKDKDKFLNKINELLNDMVHYSEINFDKELLKVEFAYKEIYLLKKFYHIFKAYKLNKDKFKDREMAWKFYSNILDTFPEYD